MSQRSLRTRLTTKGGHIYVMRQNGSYVHISEGLVASYAQLYPRLTEVDRRLYGPPSENPEKEVTDVPAPSSATSRPDGGRQDIQPSGSTAANGTGWPSRSAA